MSITLHAAFSLASALPRVEDPWPDSIGWDLPFTLAGAGGVIGSFVAPTATPAERDRLAIVVSRWFFGLGALFYTAALLAQLSSAR